MKTDTLIISLEKPQDYNLVEQLAADAFGPGRFTRTAFRLREGVPHEPDLSFVAHKADKLVGAVRLTKIMIGSELALLLGPLVVIAECKNTGVGAKLMTTSMNAAKAAGHGGVILVGDLPYYERFGFSVVKPGKITMPGPVDPERLLFCPLTEDDNIDYHGEARKL